jgi:hypothetical protein
MHLDSLALLEQPSSQPLTLLQQHRASRVGVCKSWTLMKMMMKALKA